MSFWFIAGVMILASVVVSIWPLTRTGRSSPTHTRRAKRKATVRALYRDRLREIDDDVAGGRLAADARQEVVEELGAALLNDFQSSSSGSDQPESAPESNPNSNADADPDAAAELDAGDPPALGIALALALLLPALSLGLYLHVGEPTADRVIGAEALLRLDPDTQSAEIEGWQNRLAERVKLKADDAQSWYLLGHARLQLADFPRAAEAFAMAHALHGDDPSVDVYWLQARYLAAGGVLDEGARIIAQRLLQSAPNQPMVLEMFAIDAFRRSDFRGAVEFLNRALAGNLNPSQRATLSAGLTQARTRLGDLRPSLDVAVTASGSPPVGATLFVIARPPGGGMPYAVVRRPATQLPTSVRLDDAVSMSQAQALSKASQVEVVVRLSLSGSAMAQPGDWEWRSEILDLPGLEAPLQLDALLRDPEPLASPG
jgi:cytochrome c-type biogenesis protein CcmH